MADQVYKKIQLVGTSTTSLSDAVAAAVAKAEGEARWFEVVEQRGNIVDGKIQQFQVTVNIGVRIQ